MHLILLMSIYFYDFLVEYGLGPLISTNGNTFQGRIKRFLVPFLSGLLFSQIRWSSLCICPLASQSSDWWAEALSFIWWLLFWPSWTLGVRVAPAHKAPCLLMSWQHSENGGFSTFYILQGLPRVIFSICLILQLFWGDGFISQHLC